MHIIVSMSSMIWTAWNNGSGRRTGAGYGFKVDVADRRYFDRGWRTVSIELAGGSGFVTAVAKRGQGIVLGA
jgi:hypothetical protein